MRHFKCLACKRPLRSNKSEADPIGDLSPVCGSLLEPVGGAREIVGYRVIETRVSTAHSAASRAVELIADRVGEIIRSTRVQPRTNPARNQTLRRSLCQPTGPSRWLSRSRHGRGSCLTPPPRSHQSCAAASAARPRSFRRRASSALTAPPDESSRFGLGSAGAPRNGIDAEPRPRRHLRAWRPREHHGRRVPGRQATDRHEPV